jgi:Spy/CpxP family protein refolding chaperone
MWRVILAVVVIFGAGVVTGGLIARSTLKPVAANPQPPTPMPGGPPGTGMWSQSRAQFVQKMHRQLDLTPDQCKQVDAIMKAGHERMAKLWEPVAPQAREETKNVRLQIQAILTPQQLAKFEEVFKPHKRPENWNHKDKEHSETNSAANKTEIREQNGSLKICTRGRDATPEPITVDDWIAEYISH